MNLRIIIELPQNLIDALDNIANNLYDDFKGKYAKKEHFWITLRHINNVDDFTLKQIKSALYSIASKSDPFILYCDTLTLLNPRKKSSLVYSLRGLTGKLYNLHQNIENTLYTRQIKRDEKMSFPNIELAQKVTYKQLPYTRTPQFPIEIGSIILVEIKQSIGKLEYKQIEEFPLFGGHLYVLSIKNDIVKCENTYGKVVSINSIELPKDVKPRDVIKKTGAQYTVDINETRVRSIQRQIKQEQIENSN